MCCYVLAINYSNSSEKVGTVHKDQPTLMEASTSSDYIVTTELNWTVTITATIPH
jgi:hypothetical protein